MDMDETQMILEGKSPNRLNVQFIGLRWHSGTQFAIGKKTCVPQDVFVLCSCRRPHTGLKIDGLLIISSGAGGSLAL